MATQTFARSALTAHERPVLRRRRKPSACGSASVKYVSCRSRVQTCGMIGFRRKRKRGEEMSEAIRICYKCTRFRRDYNTGSISCRCHGFYPDRPHTMPKSCSNYEYDERKEK